MIDIVIPNYNGNKYLKECIDSLYIQTYSNFRVIIIDNASTDSNYKWLDKYENIVFKRLDRNYGFDKAVNEGIKLSNTEYVVLLNNDTVARKYWLENLIKCIKSDDKIFSVCSKMIRYDDKNIIDDAGDEYNALGWGYKIGDGQPITSHIDTKEVFSSCAGAAIYRRSVLDEIGYFDEQFFAYMEDIDISYRAKIYGYKNIYCADAHIYHIGSATSGSKYNAFKVKLAARNNVYVPYKNMPIIQLIINLPFLILGFLVKYLFFIKKGFGTEYINGFIEGLQTLNKVSKVKFKFKNIVNYINIEYELLVNTIKYVLIKLKLIR
ncbi:glycosyltransferase family 2 protein [Romboutsia lituseburensis]|uniref:glycosyltransferase family 2 protein n=1 Tax=Romboutsia lituseburensis TaxID=1537 RepID=UPI00215A118D|nr:glycosyltransferase family 2 protein [Romboutsia lituseburensis]MCR8745447.1 glycosyltransferase family 2 protein [Romboutsia lituseburensis]